MTILLDTGPLGLITNPNAGSENKDCQAWLRNLIDADCLVILPEIADYELRRELLRANKRLGLQRLDQLKAALEYLPLNTETMLKAAELWAHSRRSGHPTAPDLALDADMILAAQAWFASEPSAETVIATTNPKHLDRFANAKHWVTIDVP